MDVGYKVTGMLFVAKAALSSESGTGGGGSGQVRSSYYYRLIKQRKPPPLDETLVKAIEAEKKGG